jgi:hypothetical protein
MTAEQARSLANNNSLRIQIDNRIEKYASNGRTSIDIGMYGYDVKVCIPHLEQDKLMAELKKDGFKIEARRNSQGLLLAYIISW